MMKTLTTLTPTLALTLALLTLPTQQALACSCREGTIADQFENANLVLTAKVLATKKQKNDDWMNVLVTLEPKLVWKGDAEEKLQLTTADNSAACGYGFEKKKEYLVFVHKDEKGELHSSLCSGNELASRAKESIDWLNKNHPIGK